MDAIDGLPQMCVPEVGKETISQATDNLLKPNSRRSSLSHQSTCATFAPGDQCHGLDHEEDGEDSLCNAASKLPRQCSFAESDDFDVPTQWRLPGCVPEDDSHVDTSLRRQIARSRTMPDLDQQRPGSANSNRTSLCSTSNWHEPNETLILFDWDDTLCPSTCCKHLIEAADSTANENPLLIAHQAVVLDLLRSASQHGGVVIVTMAKASWVEQSIQNLMPAVAQLLRELGIEVIGARATKKRLFRESMKESREPSQFLKREAMSRVIKSFYRKGGVLRRAVGMGSQRSWKNIISIGDSHAERFALQDIVFRHVQRDKKGRWKECRCKTVLLMDEPQLGQLTVQLRHMADMLPTLVRHDGDLDVDVAVDASNVLHVSQSSG